MKEFLTALGRLTHVILDTINKSKKRDAVENAADTIANGGVVQHSEQSIGDIPDEHGSDSDK